MKIAIVGPCAAGKSTLEINLKKLGYDAHAIAQEHSGVQTMWQRITRPDLVIYLDANIATINARRKANWEPAYLAEMNRRLTHARTHADFFLDTNNLSIDLVLTHVRAFLESLQNENHKSKI
jgi:deoxyadenosine/deoxycytidine kinase